MAEKKKITDKISEDDFLLNESEVASLIGVDKRCLQAWRFRKTYGPPYIAISNRCIRYRKKDIQDWLESKRTKNAEKEL